MLSIRKLGAVGKTYRHLNRYRQILRTLIRYGFGSLVDSLNLERYNMIDLRMRPHRKKANIEKLSRPVRVRMALEELGPTFIKLGQALSTRPDLVPLEYANELSTLQDTVSPVSFQEIRAIIEEDSKQPIDEIYAWIEEKPIAAASIAQVHKAQLKNGEIVVIKVQRPGIKKVIEVDLEILHYLASIAEKNLKEIEMQQPTRMVV